MKAALYRLSQHVLAPGADKSLSRLLSKQGHPQRSLDVGCGPASWLWGAGIHPYGVDVCPEFVRAYRRVGPGAIMATATALPFADAVFDHVWSVGLLHHLSDADARASLREMTRVTRPGGHVVVLDAVPPVQPWRRPIAWLLRRFDAGAHVRSQESLTALLSERRWWTERVTYSYTGLEGLLCRTEVSPVPAREEVRPE